MRRPIPPTLEKLMKNVEKLALVTAIFYCVGEVGSRVSAGLALAGHQAGWSTTTTALFSMTHPMIMMAIRIVIAVWLYRVARREKMTPGVWALTGLTLMVDGAILFFAVLIFNRLKLIHGESESDGGSRRCSSATKGQA